MKKDEIKSVVKKHYSKIAVASGGCCSSCGCGQSSSEKIAKSIGYSDSEINSAPNANLGLGCGNPTALAKLKKGDVVLDLGSGAGFDCFLAAKQVGSSGKVVGVDFSKEMVEKAKENAKHWSYQNIDFRLGDIESLPVENNSIDVVVSNCVINLAPDKSKVFSEAYRVLKDNGRMYLSDIVLLEDIPDEVKKDEELLAGCVSGALLKDDYLNVLESNGFRVNILAEDKEISKRQYQGIPLESIKIEAVKI